MRHILGATFLALLVSLALLAAQRGAQSTSGELPGDPVAGGRIYDNWILALDLAPPLGDHPLWANQENNQRSGVVTWRCVECHGWDYKGVDGSYGAYSTHYTGFPSLEEMVGSSQEQVLDQLDGSANPNHNFLGLTDITALNDLAAFLRTQQVDTDLIIDPSTGESLGEREPGRDAYLENCVSCHGTSGGLINFGTTLEPLYLGDLAVVDPWQTVHKIRFGTPGADRMPASEDKDWSLSTIADVLAYLQTLPRGNPDYDILSADPDAALSVDSQGQIEPIIWAAFVMVGIVAISMAWDLYSKRQTK